MSWNEANLHRHIGSWPRPGVLLGSALSDGAALRRLRGSPVVCSDQVIGGVHVELDAPPAAIGRKAAARALSDLAASVARPRAIEACLRAPRETSERWIVALLAGLRREAERHGAALVGGDLAAAPGPFGVAVTALGEFLGPGRPPGRDRLRAGQAVILTGPVGGSLLGRHLRIEPRFRAGQALFAAGARALMDVSDGLALDLSRLARASGLGIQLEAVPIHRDARRRASASGRTALDHALTDGEDHELIASLPPSKAERLLRGGLPDCPGALRIGTVIARPGLWLRFPGERPRRWSGPGGYVHGEEPPR